MSKPLLASAIPMRASSSYPQPFAARVQGRLKRALGDQFGLKSFGANLTTLKPGAISALHHTHTVQDELIYIVAGTPLLTLGDETHRLSPGMVAGFPAGGPAHHLRNDTDGDVVYLEIGDRLAGDDPVYPDDDLAPARAPDGSRVFRHKDGRPY